MENRIRLREAVQIAKDSGNKIRKGVLAMKIFPGTSQESASVRLNNYVLGKSTAMNPETVRRVCGELNCDANFLFGVEPISNKHDREETITSDSGPISGEPGGNEDVERSERLTESEA